MNKQTTPTPVSTTQSISVGIRLAGEQPITIDTHGQRRDVGSYIAVNAPGTVVYVYDERAAATYADAWIDLTASPLLGQLTEQITDYAPAELRGDQDSPAIVIRAHGHDQVKHFTAVPTGAARLAVAIRIGQVTWLVQDRTAYHSHAEAWRQVRDLASIVLPRR